MTQTSCRSWAVRWRPAPQARVRLICLPHTGAGAGIYRSWGALLGPEIDVVAVRLPGREARFQEPPFDRLDRLVPALTAALLPLTTMPYALFGHSMGALLAFETARQLDRVGAAPPVRLIVSGRRAPQLPPRETPVHDQPVPVLLDRLRELNGTPPEVLADSAAMAMLLPLLRADFAVSETYRYRPAAPRQCPISVLGGAQDATVDLAELTAWQDHSTAECAIQTFPGGHFFLHVTPLPVLSALGAELLRAVSAVPSSPVGGGW